MNTLLADLRYGLRLLRQAPVFSAIAVLALALGIGANTAIFSSVQQLLLRPLPYKDPGRLAMVWEDVTFAGFPKNTPAPANYFDWKEQNRVFTDMAATRGSTVSLTADGPPEQVMGRGVTANFFPVLGAQPLLGRTFSEEEERSASRVVVISYRLWQRRYAGDRAAIGRTMLMNGNPFTIIGIMPREFVFGSREHDFWVLMVFPPAARNMRTSHFLNVVARMKPGVTIAQAREEMGAIGKRLEKQYPNGNTGVGVVVVPLREELLGNTRPALVVLMCAAACVLLIACANLAGLLLARAVSRQREMAVRAALGAGRRRLVRQMVTEGLLLSFCGGILGLAVAIGGMRLLGALAPLGFAGSGGARLDSSLLLFTLGLSILTGLLFSAVPALQISGASLNDALRQGGRGGSGVRSGRARDSLVVLEVSAALVLLVGAGLMLKTLARLRAIEIGFRPDHLLTMRTTLPAKKYQGRQLPFFDRVVDGVRALPGVEDAAYGSMLPFLSPGNTQSYQVEGRRPPRSGDADALLRVGTNDYLKTLGVRLVEGRVPDARDGAGAPPVIVVNETLARIYWPNESALGHRIAISAQTPTWRTIIGVVKDVHERGYELAMKPGVYIPFAQYQDTWAIPEYLVVRTRSDPAALTGAVRRVIAGVDPEQPAASVKTMDEVVELDVADRRQQMTLLGAFAGLALLLASIGLYGVLSYAVTQRSREIGVRMALGATAGGVVRMVVARGLLLTAAGLVIGVAGALAATRSMKTMLYGVEASDPSTFAGVAALLCVIAAIACWLPARRAARVDPVTVLRVE